MANIYRVMVKGKGKFYLPESDALDYASKGFKIKKSKLPKNYQL